MQNIQKNLRDTGTAGNILYLFLSFPLGLIYFIFLAIGLSLGLSTAIIWIGIPILMLVLTGLWGMAALERELAVHLLHVEIPVAPNRQPSSYTWRSWFRARISDPLTWKSLIYVLIKFPLGIFSLVLTLTLVVLSAAFILEPVAYLLNVSIDSLLLAQHIQDNSWLPFVGFINAGQFDPLAFVRSFIGFAAGIVLWGVTRYILNGMAWMCGEFARIMLSSDVRPRDEYLYQDHSYQQQANMEDRGQYSYRTTEAPVR